ncbi:hypothetical protein GGQ68_004713 [Sagittula marina]|uniref:Methyltransferase, FkbM family n=1 Tax=Sagittula marina TaxID=943940 RepID=A0A7W6DSF3_9RHOB|nr:hypothetical protein [Sagittula marina]MBB3988356.1 hypothetical protein [Sagittula marina]
MPDAPPFSAAVLDLLPPLTETAVADGYILDAMGTRTQRRFRRGSSKEPGLVQLNPMVNWEWIPLAWAMMTAQDRMTAVELGAGWGPWVSRCHVLAGRLGIEDRHIFAVEAEPMHFSYLETQMADNAIPPEDHTLVQGLIAEHAGFALFPLTETPEQSWGLRQLGEEGQSLETLLARTKALPIEGEEGLYRLPKWPHKYAIQQSLSLAELIGDTPLVDFMHVDIQGNETKVLPPSMDLLNARFRVIAVGTHSHEIEAELRDCFTANGWICYHDSIMHHDDNNMLRDGHQVWLNPRLGPKPGPG